MTSYAFEIDPARIISGNIFDNVPKDFSVGNGDLQAANSAEYL